MQELRKFVFACFLPSVPLCGKLFFMELNEFQIAFGARVRQLREQKNMSAKQVAEKDGILTAPYLSQIENGKVNATLDLVRRLSKTIGEPAHKFFEFQ